MLRLSLLALLAVSSSSSLALASPQPSFLSDLLTSATTTAHKLLGQKVCPLPAFLPESCVGNQSVATVYPRLKLDACCTEIPGGRLLSTQFWDTGKTSVGPNSSWTLHGLWPDRCDGSYDANCAPEREYDNYREILQENAPADLLPFMDTYWKDYQGNDDLLWKHEGNCMSTIRPECYSARSSRYTGVVDYFERAVREYKLLPTHDWLAAAGIVPSLTATYTLAQLQAVAVKNHGHEATWGCSGGAIDEVWYHFTIKGPVAGGKMIPAAPDGSKSTCAETGLHYYPKYVTIPSPSTGSGSGSGSSNSTDTKAFFNVLPVDGTPANCLISSGKTIGSGTCAGYYLAALDASVKTISAGVEFKMNSSKGPCKITDASEISCATGNTFSNFTLDADNNLNYASSPVFYIPSVPAGATQVAVSTVAEPVEIRLQFAKQ